MAICFIHKKEFTNDCCPDCFTVEVPLTVELEHLYKSGEPYKAIYISDLPNNCSKVHKHFNKNVDLNNLGFTLTITFPEGVVLCGGGYTHAYMDEHLSHLKSELEPLLKLKENVNIKLVEGTKLIVRRNEPLSGTPQTPNR